MLHEAASPLDHCFGGAKRAPPKRWRNPRGEPPPGGRAAKIFEQRLSRSDLALDLDQDRP